MSKEMKNHVVDLLNTYHVRERRIAILNYELEHPAKVSETEQIEAMSYARGDSTGQTTGRVSNKTLYIALNYEELMDRENEESRKEIADELFSLEQQQKRLRYFISLLEERQAEVIRLVFIDKMAQKDVSARLSLTPRTIERIKKSAIEALTELYEYSERFKT